MIEKDNKFKNKLQAGERYESYRALCEQLGEKYKSGKSKQLQIRDWSRYFSSHREGQAWIIDKVFDEPFPKVDKRSAGNSRKWTEEMDVDVLANYADHDDQYFADKYNVTTGLVQTHRLLLGIKHEKGRLFGSENGRLRNSRIPKGYYVYRYVHPNYPWLYVGKTIDLDARIYSHANNPRDNIDRKYKKLINESEIYYIELTNDPEMSWVETYLIDKYKPYLNKACVQEGGGTLEVELPEWKKYDLDILQNDNAFNEDLLNEN